MLFVLLLMGLYQMGLSQRSTQRNQKVACPPLVIKNVTPKCEEGEFVLAVSFAQAGCSTFCHDGETWNFVITSGENSVEIVPAVLTCLTTEITVSKIKCDDNYSIVVHQDLDGDKEYDEGEDKTAPFSFYFPSLIPCCGSPNLGCCPGSENLMQFSDFEALSLLTLGGIPSDYEKEEAIAPGSLAPGEYAFLNEVEANTICNDWYIRDHTTCNDDGIFVVVNGNTGQDGSKKVWSGNVNIQAGKNYTFCAYFRNLSSSCGNQNPVTPKVDVKFGMENSNFDILDQVIITDPSDGCNWMKISRTISFDFDHTLNISIHLDESEAGDGNVLAIDDISIQEIPPLPDQYVKFGLSIPIDQGDGFYRFTATAAAIPDAIGNCNFAWEIVKLDDNYQEITGTKIYNPSEWWALPTYATSINFPGYNPLTNTLQDFSPSSSWPAGRFKYAERYRITRAVWCDCYSWNKSSLIIEPVGN